MNSSENPKSPHLIQVRAESLPPERQGLGVVRRDVLQVGELKIGRAAQRLADGPDRGQAAAGEDVSLDEIHRPPVAIVALVGNDDRLQAASSRGA